MLRCCFISLEPKSLNLLQYILKSYQAGVSILAQDALFALDRDLSVKQRVSKDIWSPPPLWQRSIGLFLVVCLGVLALWVLGGNIYQSLLTRHATEAVVLDFVEDKPSRLLARVKSEDILDIKKGAFAEVRITGFDEDVFTGRVDDVHSALLYKDASLSGLIDSAFVVVVLDESVSIPAGRPAHVRFYLYKNL